MAYCIDIIIGTLIIAYVISINIISSTTFSFSIPFIEIGLLFILYHYLKGYFNNKKYFITIKRIFLSFFFVALFFFMLIEAFIIGFPKINKDTTDYIIVLGTSLNKGNYISKTLRDRLDTAVKSVYNDGDSGYIVVSGGKGVNEEISESDAMERYLVDQGVPRNKIIKETKSRNIFESLKYSKALIEEHSDKDIRNLSIKIVTTDFNALQSDIIAKKLNYKDVKFNTSTTTLYFIPVYYTREAFDIIRSLVD